MFRQGGRDVAFFCMTEYAPGHAVAPNHRTHVAVCTLGFLVLGRCHGATSSVRAALIRSQAATQADSVSSAAKDPKVSLAQADTVVHERDLHALPSQLNQHVLKALDQKAKAEEEVNKAFIDQAQQVLQDKKVAEQIKVQVESQPIDPSVAKISLETAVRRVEAAMKEHIANKKTAAEFAAAEIENLINNMSKKDNSLVASLQRHKKETDEAAAPCDAKVEKDVAEWRKWIAENAADGPKLADKLKEVNVAIKNYTGVEEFCTLKAKVNSIQTFKLQAEKAIKQADRQTLLADAAKGTISDAGLADCPILKALLQYLIEQLSKSPGEPPFNGSINNRWSLKGDFVDPPEASAVTIPKEQLADTVNQIKGIEYFETQKTWCLELMKKKKLTQGVSAIVKPAIERRVRGFLMNHLKDLADLSDTVGYGEVVKTGALQPQFTQLGGNSTKLALAPDYGLSEVRLTLVNTEHILGIPYAKLGEGTLADKETRLKQMSIGEFKSLVISDGFYVQLSEGTMVVLPGRFAIVSINPPMRSAMVCGCSALVGHPPTRTV